MTHDIAAFLTARLDEDEAAAKAAGFSQQSKTRQRHWTAHQPTEGPGGEVPFLFGVKVTDTIGIGVFIANGGDRAEHVARHDPARVLADVSAKRAMVAECVRTLDVEESGFWLAELVLKQLAAVYADRTDFSEAWRP